MQEHMKVNDLLVDFGFYVDRYAERFKGKDDTNEIWSEIPIPFSEFIVSQEHMNFDPFSERQISPVEFLLGDDTATMFTNGNYMAVICAGKGSGKDTIAWATMNYLTYVLLCLKNPQRFVGLPAGEPIDLLNVSYTAGQASNVFFDRMKYRVRNWKWLQNKYHVKVSGTSMSARERNGIFLDHVAINSNGILYPNGVRAFSGNSSEESCEGLNLLFWVADEISAFKDNTQTRNASKMFDMLRTSATSRFGNKWKSLILSYPRFKDDMIERLIKMYSKELHVYTDRATTWEMKPKKCFSEKTFTYEGMEIPIDFQDEFRLHPESSMTKYAVRPSGAESPLFSRPVMVDLCVNKARLPIFEFGDEITEDKFGQKYIKKHIIQRNIGISQQMFVIDIDLGLSGDSAAMSIGHLDDETDKVVLDAHTAWTPIPEQGIVVSIVNVEDLAKEICEIINVGGVFYDRWQSARSIEGLSESGFHSGVVSVKFKDWLDLRERIYSERIDILPDIELIGQLKHMQNIKDMKIDHPVDGHDDRAYSLAGLTKVLTSLAIETSKVSEEGEVVGSNIGKEGFLLPKGNSYLLS